MRHWSIIAIFAVMTTVTIGAANASDTGLEAAIVHMLEEEKLARDVYSTLGDLWNLRIFTNIAASEEQHRSRVQDLAEAYGVDFQATAPGEFVDPDFRELYADLVAAGSKSLESALEVGRTIEILDIADIDDILESDPPADVREVLEALRRGSENHLAAFERQLS